MGMVAMWEYKGQKRPPFAEEPGPGQESVWDYPRPPTVVICEKLVEVKYNDQLIAHSNKTYRVLETASPPTFYIPNQDIDWSLLTEINHHTYCEWKGEASYWALAGDPDGLAVAWYYKDPLPAFVLLREHTSFYPGRVDCYVDDELVRPQSSEFYGGWVTKEIVGPFKGDPATMHW
jgi:uncharacterized protein (DUF427 family)